MCDGTALVTGHEDLGHGPVALINMDPQFSSTMTDAAMTNTSVSQASLPPLGARDANVRGHPLAVI